MEKLIRVYCRQIRFLGIKNKIHWKVKAAAKEKALQNLKALNKKRGKLKTKARQRRRFNPKQDFIKLLKFLRSMLLSFVVANIEN
jgi:hypothetical protein